MFLRIRNKNIFLETKATYYIIFHLFVIKKYFIFYLFISNHLLQIENECFKILFQKETYTKNHAPNIDYETISNAFIILYLKTSLFNNVILSKKNLNTLARMMILSAIQLHIKGNKWTIFRVNSFSFQINLQDWWHCRRFLENDVIFR